MSENTTFVVDEGDLRKYRTETPNMIYDLGLDPYTGWLYSHIKRIAGDKGVCDGGTRTLAKIARMSHGQIVKSKKLLKEKGLIRVVEHPRESGLADEIYVTNIWRENFEHFDGAKTSSEEPEETRSLDDHPPVHVVNTAKTACSCGDHPCSCGDHKKEPLSSLKETSPDGDAKKGAGKTTRHRVRKLSDEEAGKRWEGLCTGDPHGDSLRKLAELLAAENATGQVAITRVWNELGERYLKKRTDLEPRLSEAAWAFGFERAIARPAPNIGWVVKAAGSYEPPRGRAPAAKLARATTEADYDEARY